MTAELEARTMNKESQTSTEPLDHFCNRAPAAVPRPGAQFGLIGELPCARFPDMVRVIEVGVVLHAIYRRPKARVWKYLLDLDWWYAGGPDRNGRALGEIVQRHGCCGDLWFSDTGGKAKFQALESAEAALQEIDERWPAAAAPSAD